MAQARHRLQARRASRRRAYALRPLLSALPYALPCAVLVLSFLAVYAL